MNNALIESNHQLNNSSLPPQLAGRIQLYPENRRRSANKILFKNEYFYLIYNVNENRMSIQSQGDIVYSAIPYDTSRKYIERAAIQYLLDSESVNIFVKAHKPVIETYLAESLSLVKREKIDENHAEVAKAYDLILNTPLLEIQIAGRLLQHNETGPLSANLPGKFLFEINKKTGISEYVAEYLTFVIKLTQLFPLATDGENVKMLENSKVGKQEIVYDSEITEKIDTTSAMLTVPQGLECQIEKSKLLGIKLKGKPLLRSANGTELSEVRKNYFAHSINPMVLEPFFENVLPTENFNQINVVSDIHSIDGVFPFSSKTFNILAGDISDSHIVCKDIQGIYVIGNHELVNVLPLEKDASDWQWRKWRRYQKHEWFQELKSNPDKAWPLLPVGSDAFYKDVQSEIENRFPQMYVLNNDSIEHDGIRYIGLTVPVALVKRKKEQQRFIYVELRKLLRRNHDIRTVIISHAPLFNEISMLSQNSHAYNKDYTCSNPKIEKLFADYNIIGVIHGHHHIPASSGRYKIVRFAGKELFVVCSIYSKINTGFELTKLLDQQT